MNKKENKSLLLGRHGEKVACRLLRTLGMEILCKNFSSSYGEIDIICRDNVVLCFVEVKTRSYHPLYRPLDAVTEKKRDRIKKTAAFYLRQIGDPKITWRFDIIELIFLQKKLMDARYWPREF